ncbi:unnamed protein product [Gordionus sp. m RMFG-2023]|uniref:peptidyl-prolyl cis-trans isomerase G-like n=1 Tax=Gordionus sp. m RMFG-2023 TaxID=3053472 RepID=UPI0030E3D3B2
MDEENDTTAVKEERPARPRCFMDISIGKSSNSKEEQVFRIIIELYADICPLTCENFRCLCTGEKGTSQISQKLLTYKDSVFHRIVKNFMIQGGDIIMGNGKSGESIYGKHFDDENFEIKHDRPYILSMANKGKNTNSSQFFITTIPAPHLDGNNVAFGHVVSGQSALTVIESIPVDETFKPALPITITKCGELVLQIRPKISDLNQNLESSKEKDETGSLRSYTESSEEDGIVTQIDKSQSKIYDEETILNDSSQNAASTQQPPEIPKNFLLRSCPLDFETNGDSSAKDAQLLEKSEAILKILTDKTHSIPYADDDAENRAKIKALKSMFSAHVPNLESLAGDSSSRHRESDHDRNRNNRDNYERGPRRRSPSRERRYDDRRRKDNFYDSVDKYYEDRKNRQSENTRSRYRPDSPPASSYSAKKRIPQHILKKLREARHNSRSRSRGDTPPHWKEAQKRLIKLDQLINAPPTPPRQVKLTSEAPNKSIPSKIHAPRDEEDGQDFYHKFYGAKQTVATVETSFNSPEDQVDADHDKRQKMLQAFWPEGKPQPIPQEETAVSHAVKVISSSFDHLSTVKSRVERATTKNIEKKSGEKRDRGGHHHRHHHGRSHHHHHHRERHRHEQPKTPIIAS